MRMKLTVRKTALCLALAVLVAVILPAGAAFAQEATHEPVTEELIALLEDNPDVRDMLEQSIAAAQKVNPDPKTNPVQSVEDYFDFIDESSKLLPQDTIENTPGLEMRDKMLQGICYSYFLVDQPLTELEDEGLYKNTLQYYEPFASWLRSYAKAHGEYMDTEDSWNDEIYQSIYDAPEFGLQKDWYESPSNWKTFNEFFAKYLKSPDVRPVASPDDPSVVVAPADSVPQGVWAIDEDSQIEVEDGLDVKLTTFYAIEDLLGPDSAYKDAFAEGTLTHTFLNVNDYHRYHFGVGGEVKEMDILERNVALEVSWDEDEKKYVPQDSTGWQFSQTLGYVVVDTDSHGLVALIPMGMAHVSSVNFEDDVTVGSSHDKGDPLGNFLFGGSDFVMLFEKDADFDITAPKADADTYEHILVGEAYGAMEGQMASSSGGNYWWIAMLVFLVVAGIGYAVVRKKGSSATS